MNTKHIFAALTIALSATACGHDAHDHKEGHDHDESLQLTAYTDNLELYAEATPLVAGEEAEILAHFTQLSDFKPVASGAVTVILKTGNDTTSQTVASPASPGIYKFTLTPARSGVATLEFVIKTPDGTDRFNFSGLTVYDDEHEAHHAASEAAVHTSNGVAFTKEMSWRVNFSTTPVASRQMGQVIRTMAQVEPSQGDVRTITARSNGQISYVSPTLTEGQTVSAGQPLFRIDASGTPDDNLRVRYLEAKNNLEAAKSDYERKAELAAERLITQTELLRAKQEYDNARAVFDSLENGFAGGVSTVTSPIAGYLTQIAVTNGQYVTAGQTLATVAQNRDLYIRAEVQPSYFPYLHSITGANLRRPNSSEVYTLDGLNGSVVSYGKSADRQNPLIPVVLRVDNSAGFIPGTFVELYITAGDNAPVLAVPNRSLIEEMGNYFVYVQLTPEYFEKREVETGRTDGLYTEITGGLADGERVVADGAILVKLAHASGTLDAHSGHVH